MWPCVSASNLPTRVRGVVSVVLKTYGLRLGYLIAILKRGDAEWAAREGWDPPYWGVLGEASSASTLVADSHAQRSVLLRCAQLGCWRVCKHRSPRRFRQRDR